VLLRRPTFVQVLEQLEQLEAQLSPPAVAQ
jgi:hypothetical protein